MANIIFLAPNENLWETAQTTLNGPHPDIGIERGLLSEGVKTARKLVAQGADIIITRGGTAAAIKASGLEVIIVEVPITGFDIINAMEQARCFGKRIAVVTFASMIAGIECLGPILDVDIRKYIIANEFEAEDQSAGRFSRRS